MTVTEIITTESFDSSAALRAFDAADAAAAFPVGVGAVPLGESVTFRIICDGAAEGASLRIHADGLSSGRGEQGLCVAMEGSLCEHGYMYTASLAPGDLRSISEGNLFYYHYELTAGGNTLRYGGEGARPEPMTALTGERQLLVYERGGDCFLPGGFIYHIFVDRFASSGRYPVREGGIAAKDWYSCELQHASVRGGRLENNEFFGGDLDGVTEKLGYLSSLGVTAIYLSPVFDSPSNHKYDTSDYMHVDPAFGGDGAFVRLCSAAKELGIAVILDGVFNHTGADSRYFDIRSRYGDGAYRNPDSPYRSWYRFGATDDDYECWWGIKILPRVSSSDPDFHRFIVGEDGVIRRYMRLGASGFRLDVADELSDGFIADIRRAVTEEKPDGAVIGEVWEDASCKISYGQRRRYLWGGELHSVMNYPMREAVIRYLLDGDNRFFEQTVLGIYRRYPHRVSDSLMNFLGTHDTERILTVLGGVSGEGRSEDELSSLRMTAEQREKALRLLRCAFAILFTVYGVPSVFYGDEAGVEGYHDPFCRRPYPWGREDTDLRAWVGELGMLRRSRGVYAHGLFRLLTALPDLLVFSRGDGVETVYTAVVRGETVRYSFPYSCVCLCSSGEPPRTENGRTFELLPYTAYVFAVGQQPNDQQSR